MCKMYNFHVTSRVNGAEVSHSSMILPYLSTTKPCALVVVSHTLKENRLGQYTSDCWETKASGFLCPNVVLLITDHNTALLP